jgi:hypothetical protein
MLVGPRADGTRDHDELRADPAGRAERAGTPSRAHRHELVQLGALDSHGTELRSHREHVTARQVNQPAEILPTQTPTWRSRSGPLSSRTPWIPVKRVNSTARAPGALLCVVLLAG